MPHNIKSLTDREHIRLRPAMYIGSVDMNTSNEYIIEDNKIVFKEINFVPGLIKIINEILDNSIDVAIKSDFKTSNLIEVNIDSKKVQIQDNGTGIPVLKNKQGKYLPEICWNSSRAGSNFDDDANRTQIGMNGVGSYATACFSKKFIGETDDSKKSYKIIIKDGASSFTESVSETKKQGTKVTFYPDLEMFNLTEIDEVHQLIIKQRLINLSMSFPKITFKFNKRKINTNNFRNYLKMFSDTFEMYESEDFNFALLPNDDDDFKQFSYVNGLKIPDGGTHIDIIISNIVQGIREKLVKKYKTIKPGDIRNKLMLIVFMKNLKNPKFNSQAKEKITNSVKEINQYFGNIDYQKIVNKILKTPEIIDNITELYRAKEEIQRRKELNGLTKKKNIRSEKYLPAIKNKKYLFITEGACLDEETCILMSDFSTKKIKDIEVNDKVIGSNLEEQRVIAKTKLLKKTITIVVDGKHIISGELHRFKVYNKEKTCFEFRTAKEIKENKSNFMLLKSKINDKANGLQVTDTTDRYIIRTDEGDIHYTDNDYFVIIRDKLIIRVNAKEIREKDMLILS